MMFLAKAERPPHTAFVGEVTGQCLRMQHRVRNGHPHDRPGTRTYPDVVGPDDGTAATAEPVS